jgi:DNA polymerase-2
MATEAFLLTRQWRDTPEGVELVFWAASLAGPVRIQLEHQESVCFVERSASIPEELLPKSGFRRQSLELRSLQGRPVDGLYFRNQRSLVETSNRLKDRGVRVYESDLKPTERYVSERFITGGLHIVGTSRRRSGFLEFHDPKMSPAEFRPELRVVSLDIETEDIDGDIYSISVTEGDRARVFLVESDAWGEDEKDGLRRGPAGVHVSLHRDERSLLAAFFPWLSEYDPDVIIGWNVVDFDLTFIQRRCRKWNTPFALGRGGETATILPAGSIGQKSTARIPGRVVLDGIDLLRAATWSFEDFSLGAVAGELLGRQKLLGEEVDRVEEIQRLYLEEPSELVAYNLEDCRLAEAIFEEAHLIDFALERTSLTGLNLDRTGGSVAAFDNLYLPRLHRKGYVAPDVGDQLVGEESPGGYVMDSKPGLYENVVVLDFKSLYPSIIRSFKIDPLGMAVPGDNPIEGFQGAKFSREDYILPDLLARLWLERDAAKAENHVPLSRAIKIIMNSFYGVLGSTGCRFYDSRLASNITLRGHEIMTRSREQIEARGLAVLYGDTDSLFVLFGKNYSEEQARASGEQFAGYLNNYWAETLPREYGVDSFLEIELEELYLRFFMPTIRGSEKGSKKRYAGLVRTERGTAVRFTGLESVRSDWTPLARQFQRELFRRIFHDEPYEDYIQEVAADLKSGELDDKLVYRKRLRRPLGEYKKNVPPHAQAARKSKSPGRWIRYVITTRGPEPIDNNPSPLDYGHYLDRQLAPAADALLQLKGTSVKRILDAQMNLF